MNKNPSDWHHLSDPRILVTTMDQNRSASNHLDAPIIVPTAGPDFGLLDFIAESDFDHFLELMRCDDEASTDPVVADCGIGYADASQQQQQQQQRVMIEDDEVDRLMSVVQIESQFHNELGPAADIPQISMDLFAFGGDDDDGVDYGFRGDHVNGFSGDSLAGIVDDFDVGDGFDDEDDKDGNVSSGTTTTPPKKGKTDRSKTIVSERRRRGRMKDNLYALRSLVPNITKMDKASIVGDAVLYVQNLQVTAERLKREIAELEASTASLGLNATTKPANNNNNPSLTSNNNNNNGCSAAPPRYITQMDVFHVGGREFYAKLVSNQGVEIAACLHKAIESLRNGLSVRSSNLSTVVDHYVLTFTLHVREGGEGEIKLPNLKMCLSRALAGQGFILKSSPLS